MGSLWVYRTICYSLHFSLALLTIFPCSCCLGLGISRQLLLLKWLRKGSQWTTQFGMGQNLVVTCSNLVPNHSEKVIRESTRMRRTFTNTWDCLVLAHTKEFLSCLMVDVNTWEIFKNAASKLVPTSNHWLPREWWLKLGKPLTFDTIT